MTKRVSRIELNLDERVFNGIVQKLDHPTAKSFISYLVIDQFVIESFFFPLYFCPFSLGYQWSAVTQAKR